MQLTKQEQELKIYSNFYDAIKSESSKENYSLTLRRYMRFLKLWTETEDKEKEFLIQKYSKLIDMSK